MSEKDPEVLDRYNALVEEAQVMLGLTRSSRLQDETRGRIEELLPSILAERDLAHSSKQEAYANLMLGASCVMQAFSAELLMWQLLKAEKPDDAWIELVV